MATTVNPAVGNSVSLAEKYLPILDEIYERGSMSAILDFANADVKWIGANKVLLYDFTSNGLGDYSRNGGFVMGDNNGSWDSYTLACDRGRAWTVDVMDNDETLAMQLGSLLGETERRHVVPEVDAYRFAKYAMGAGAHADASAVASISNMADAVDAGNAVLDEKGVPYEGRILFISPKAYEKLKKNITRYTDNGDKNINTNVEYYNDLRVIRVPQARFNTAITLAQPSAHDGAGGYSVAGADINFLIVHPSAVIQIIKHNAPRLFAPEQNKDADGWQFNYRIYHDAFVRKNGKDGIYLSAGIPATAMSAASSTASISGTGNATVKISNFQGSIKATSANTAVCTVEITGDDHDTVKITGVAEGTANVVVEDSIGQKCTIAATVS